MPKTDSLAYRHNPQWNSPQLGDCPTKDYTAEVTTFSHPFGAHIVVSSFGGENLTSFQVSGGHGAHAMVVKQVCDSPIKVLYNGKNVEEALAAFLGSFPHKDGEDNPKLLDGEQSLRTVMTEFMGGG